MNKEPLSSSLASSDWPDFAQEMVVTGFQEVCSWRQLDSMRRGIASLVATGLMVKDVADAIYNSPRVFDAITEGDYESAARLVIAMTEEATNEVGNSGLDHSSYIELLQLGFSAGEIAWAIRNIQGLREALSGGDMRVIASSLHSFFARTGRSFHRYLKKPEP
jgi:hypothetical protein